LKTDYSVNTRSRLYVGELSYEKATVVIKRKDSAEINRKLVPTYLLFRLPTLMKY